MRRVHLGQARPPTKEDSDGKRWLTERSQLSDRPAVSGDRQLLAEGDAVDHLRTMVAQVTDRNLCHSLGVSPVRTDGQVAAALAGPSLRRSPRK